MNSDHELTRIVRSWLAEDRHEDAGRVLGLVLNQLDTAPRRRAGWLARRFPIMHTQAFRYGIVGATALIAVVLGVGLMPRNQPGPASTSSPSASQSAVPSAAATPAPSASPTTAPPSASPSAAALPPAAKVAATFNVVDTGYQYPIAAGLGSIWVTRTDGTVRIDPSSGSTLGTAPTKAGAASTITAFGALWETDTDTGALNRIDPHSLKIVAIIPVNDASGVAATADALWVTDRSDGTLVKIDPTTNRVVGTVTLAAPGDGPVDVVATASTLWSDTRNGLVGVNASTGALIGPIAGPYAPATDGQQLWALYGDTFGRAGLERLDPSSGQVLFKTPVDENDVPSLAIGNGSVWRWNKDGLYRLDPSTGRPVAFTNPCDPSCFPGRILVADGSLWLNPYVLGTVGDRFPVSSAQLLKVTPQ